MFGLGLFFFLLQHLRFVWNGYTTLESFDLYRVRSREEGVVRTKQNPYDLGPLRNFQLIFGTSYILAILPIATHQGDGCTWETNLAANNDHQNESENRTLLE